jgi:hypothetical protein
MNRKGGTTTVALLIAAVLGVSYLPRQGAERTPAPETPKGTQGSASKKAEPQTVGGKKGSKPIPACTEIAQRLQRFPDSSQKHRIKEKDIPKIESCYPDGPPGNQPKSPISPQVHFAIALVPNPVQTHLPLMFDRSIEAIQEAAQDMSFTYDSSWFPWNKRDKSYDSLSDEEKAAEAEAEQQRQPGIMVFRRGVADDKSVQDASRDCKNKYGEDYVGPECQSAVVGLNLESKFPYQEGLIVFVVGEQPTGGISDPQFEHAIDWLEKLQPQYKIKPLLILGPTFSGSLPSLARQLDVQTLAKFPMGVRIYSGSVTSEIGVRWFKLFLAQQYADLAKRQPDYIKPEFRTFDESDSLMTDRFLCYLHNAGYHLSRVAILSEDETAFGQLPSVKEESGKPESDPSTPSEGQRSPARDREQTCPQEDPAAGKRWLCGGNKNSDALKKEKPIYLYYPRDIATLRSAYERQGIFSAAKRQSANVPATTLRTDLSEAASSEHDAVRTYAGQLTPLGQESVLLNITSMLQAKKIEFVIVRSTNPLDQLFLSEFLRRSYADGRIVLDGSDLLFRRGMEGASLRGVMLLSSYPLMSWTQDGIPMLRVGKDGDWVFNSNDLVFGPTPGARRSYRVFSEDLIEGIYIAARELFPLPTGTHEAMPISDYGAPRSALHHPKWKDTDGAGVLATNSELNHHDRDDRRPLTWVSVVGHRQFWSLAMLNSFTQTCGSNPYPDTCYDQSLLKAENQENFFDSDAEGLKVISDSQQSWIHRQGPTLPGEMVALLILCVTLAVGHGLLCWKASMTGTPRARAYFAPVRSVQHPVLVFLGSLILGLLALTLAATTGLIEQFSNPFLGNWANAWILAAVIVITGSAFAGVVLNYELPVLSGVQQEGTDQGENFTPPEEPNVEWKQRLSRWRNWLAQRRKPQAWLLGLAWLLTLALLTAVRYERLNSHLSLHNFVPFILRNLHFRSGVSGLPPQVLLILGMYGWFWYNLRGLSLFGDDRPVLPPLSSLPDLVTNRKKPVFESQDDDADRKEALRKTYGPDPYPPRDNSQMRGFRMFSQEEAGKPIEDAATPLTRSYLVTLGVCLLLSFLACWAALGEAYLRTLGDRRFGRLIFLCVVVFVGVILADTLQFLRTWGRLRQLLVFLDRVRLRRTLSCLKGLSWDSVWSMSGNVMEERYRLISRQFESAQTLQNELLEWETGNELEAENRRVALQQVEDCLGQGLRFAAWYVNQLAVPEPGQPSKKAIADLTEMQRYQEMLARAAGRMMSRVILPDWLKEHHSLILQSVPSDKEGSENKPESKMRFDSAIKPHVRAAEEFFVLPYLGFIQNIMGRIRTIAFSILSLFVAATLAVSSYPFDPLPVIGAIFLILFILVGAIVIFVYAEMHRDPTLSHITNTNPGELGMDFWVRIVTFGIPPLIGLLTTLFPSMTDFVVSFLQPGAQAIK